MVFLSLDPRMRSTDSLAEWSKALAPCASPKGRGFEPHSCHFVRLHAAGHVGLLR